MTSAASDAAAAVRRLLGEEADNVRPLGGTASMVTLRSGQRLTVKHGSGDNAVWAEAAGLRWLGESGDVPVPWVHAADTEWLITDHIPAGRATPAAAAEFGAGLARLHLRGATAFGAAPPQGPADAWIGLAGMRNDPEPDWPTFYAQHRILPYVRRAVDQGQFDNAQAGVFERLCERLPQLAGPPEPPARLHGDAWSGNVHWSGSSPTPGGPTFGEPTYGDEPQHIAGRVWLLDPAAHGGHRETDLAMLRLFSIPMLDRVLGAYRDAATQAGAPLADGWEDRVGLHQLFPLLVHAVLFGGGYTQQALATANTAG